jgi:hypothetical protein
MITSNLINLRTQQSGRAFRGFSRKNGFAHIQAQPGQPLSMDLIRERTPSVFAIDAHRSRSDRYAFIPTSEVLAKVADAGFLPYSVTQGGCRTEGKRDFTKHMVRLRHVDAQFDARGTVFEIILVNSHDGSTSFIAMGGIFRSVCANGMIASDGLVQSIRMHHKGDIAAQCIDGCIDILDNKDKVQDEIALFDSIELTRNEQQAFALSAMVAKFGDDPKPFTSDKLLEVRRTNDARPSLWNTLNVVQENIIKGGTHYRTPAPNVRRGYANRTSRAVTSIDQSTNLNKALWTLAQSMAGLVTSGQDTTD